MRILIAEDDLDIAVLYKKALEKHEHSVVLTSDGSDCLKNYLTTLKHRYQKTKVRLGQPKQTLTLFEIQRLNLEKFSIRILPPMM
jgi:DNA-binding response OmpR family regulator